MAVTNQVSRRRFLRQAPTAGAFLGGAAALGQESTEAPPEVTGTIRIGALNVGAYSHLAAKWGALINARPDTGEIPYTGMRITHCWDIDPDRARSFANGYGCTAVSEFDGMLGKIDAVISGGYYNHSHNHLLHEPYLEAGLPNLVNRPFANSVGKARRLIELAQRHKASLLVPSALGHNDVVSQARQFVESSHVVGYHAAVGAEDYPTHGIHGLYMVCRAVADAGNPIQSVAFRARHWHAAPSLLTYEHHDKQGRPFYGTLHSGHFGIGALHIHTEKENHGRDFTLTTGTGDPYDKTEFWAPAIWAFERMIRTGNMPQTYDQILRKNQAFMAGWRSVLVEDGRPVRLEDVPADWNAPVELPNMPGDPTFALFRKRFG